MELYEIAFFGEEGEDLRDSLFQYLFMTRESNDLVFSIRDVDSGDLVFWSHLCDPWVRRGNEIITGNRIDNSMDEFERLKISEIPFYIANVYPR